MHQVKFIVVLEGIDRAKSLADRLFQVRFGPAVDWHPVGPAMLDGSQDTFARIHSKTSADDHTLPRGRAMLTATMALFAYLRKTELEFNILQGKICSPKVIG